MNTNDYEQLFRRVSSTGTAALTSIMEADRIKSVFSSVHDPVSDCVHRMHEEEKAQREQLLRGAIPITAVEYLKHQLGTAGTASTLAEALELQNRNLLELIRGRPVYELAQLSSHAADVASIADTLRLHNEVSRRRVFDTDAFEQAKALALASERYHLDDYLDSFRTATGALTDKMLYLGSLDSIRSPETLRAFVHASTVADILSASNGFDSQARQAWGSLTAQISPQFDTIQMYGKVLSAAGLTMPRWPHPRLLTIGEKRRRLHQRVQVRADTKYAKKAWPVLHRLEFSLRDVIISRMEQHYGEEWPRERLPQCGCKDLLGKWQKRGGDVLDHADYAHYMGIMCDPEHFEFIFSRGFDDSDSLKALLTRAKDLRVPVMHCLEFTQEDLRDMRVTWKALETGLVHLTSDVDFDFH